MPSTICAGERRVSTFPPLTPALSPLRGEGDQTARSDFRPASFQHRLSGLARGTSRFDQPVELAAAGKRVRDGELRADHGGRVGGISPSRGRS